MMLAILSTLALAAAPQAVEPVGSLQHIDVPQSPNDQVTLTVDLDGQSSKMILKPHSMRAADFKLFTTRPDGSLIEMPAPAPTTWRGYVEGRPGATVTASITAEGLSAIVADVALDLEWQIQPADGMGPGIYSVAHLKELADVTGMCGVLDTPQPAAPSTGQNRAFGTGLRLAEVSIDSDFEFYQRNASSVSATVNDIERVMNQVDAIYIRDISATFILTTIVVRTNSNDPYTTNVAGDLLDELRDLWNSTTFLGTRRDIVHLFTGKNVAGNTLGVAFQGAICNSSLAYGLSESRFTNNLANRTGLTAHEIGHNFGAGHCNGTNNCWIMCSGLGGCNNDVTQFGPQATNVITNGSLGSCLIDLAPPQSIPIFDDFEPTFLNTDLWVSQQGLQISSDGIGEPSGTRALRMNARNANEYLDDYIMSNKLLLAGESGVTVSFYAQHRGVPSGGALRSEVFDSNGDWIVLDRVVSNGVNETSFTQFSSLLPASAYHDEARVRLVAEVDSTSENWYVDNLEISDNSCGGFQTYCVAGANSVTPSGAQLFGSGSTSITANDLIVTATPAPPLSFGIWIYAANQVQVPNGGGFLCVNGPQIFRLQIVQADAFGTNVLTFDQNNLAQGSTINVGDTINLQLWYRDSIAPFFNFTNALEVIFCP